MLFSLKDFQNEYFHKFIISSVRAMCLSFIFQSPPETTICCGNLDKDYKCNIFGRRGFKILITFTEMSLSRTTINIFNYMSSVNYRCLAYRRALSVTDMSMAHFL